MSEITGASGPTIGYRPGDTLAAMHRRFGPLMRAGVGRRGFVYLMGPEANSFIFANAGLFRTREAFEVLVPVNGESSLLLSDGDVHRRRRRLMAPALHHRQIDGYLSIMAAHADATLDAWNPGQTVDAYQEFRAAIRRTTIESLFGRRLAADADFFGRHLQSLLSLMNDLPTVLALRRRFRTAAWRRAVVDRAVVDERIYAEIARTRRGEVDGDDNVLATLVNGRGEDGDALSDVEIRDQTASLIAAGYETTSGVFGWAVHAMLTVPGVWERAAEEVRSVLGDRVPTRDDLRRLTYLGGVVQETLRLWPPAVISARKIVQDFEFAGRTVHAGPLMIFSPYVTHRLPEVWAEPLSFRPQRWDPAEPGHRKPGPHEFLPFGGGAHRCLGSTMATTELTVMLARLLARTTLRPVAGRVRPVSFAALRPRDGIPVEVLTRS
ncbi:MULTISPECIES: cytochrome P450 [Actinoalloteichus]|uniref:Cytochrome P450 n=1 Tax=Actinoalloteichus fjordicus TaxID=1612552 RepID=A0AAC9PUD0_9PSEU|nr:MULTISPECIES: cytochrome P450 [Actinoalloteichus]APU16836.1 cytochrome P450 [Actinoalloteichus fjordicus]APU22901.1 cytochrome P450 [Actinoalloteichus sp. GBA129-24]